MTISCGRAVVFFIAMLLSACAQVPRESVTLAETVGRDVTAIEKSHRDFVDIVYDKYEKDVNDFVDNFYLPYYVRENLKKDSGKQLLKALQDAANPASTPQQQKTAYETAELWLQVAHQRVENMRKRLLGPLKQQRGDLSAKLTDAYGRVHKANAAVTGYLASLAKVTDIQNDLLAKLGVPHLAEQVGDAASKISAQLDQSIPRAEQSLKDAQDMKARLEEYLSRWRKSDSEGEK